MKERTRRRRALWLAAALAVLCLVQAAALAYTQVDTGQDVTLTLALKDGDTGVSGAKFSLYRVADVDASAQYTAIDTFAEDKTGVSLDTSSTESWSGRALALAGYVTQQGITPTLTGTTDTNGNLTFSSSQVQTGLYLLVGEAVTANGVTYTPETMLVSLPYLLDDDSWDYSPTLNLKYDKTQVAGLETTSLTVVKVWDDNSNAKNLRPDSVTIVLSNASGEYDRVTLNASNSWRYTWENLSAEEQWSVSEPSVPTGYTVTISEESTTYTVKNTVKSTATTTTTTGTTGTTGTSGTSTTSSTKLPQTGQLWWPVSYLAGGGLLLFLLGFWLRRREAESYES